jgi:hypothetical protein
MLTDTAPKGGYAPTLFTMLDTGFGEHIFPRTRVNKG